MQTTAIVAASYDVAKELGFGAITSGFMISAGSPGYLCGCCLGKRIKLRWPVKERYLVASSLLLLSLNSFIFAAVLLTPRGPGGDSPHTLTLAAVLACRFTSNVWEGMGEQWVHVFSIKATLRTEMTVFSTLNSLARSIGLCLGPVLASLLLLAYGGDEGIPHGSSKMAAPLLALGAIFATLMLTMLAVVPSDMSRMVQEALAEPVNDPDSANWSKVPSQTCEKVAFYSVLFNFERALTVQAIEVATTLILEVQYSWPIMDLGFAFGFVGFVAAGFLLVSSGHTRVPRLPETSLMLWSAGGAFAGSFFLLDFAALTGAGWLEAYGARQLVGADCVLYGCMFLSNGLADSFGNQAARHASGQSSSSLEDFMELKLTSIALGRLVSGPIARFIVSSAGRNAYARTQICLVFMGTMTQLRLSSLMRSVAESSSEPELAMQGGYGSTDVS